MRCIETSPTKTWGRLAAHLTVALVAGLAIVAPPPPSAPVAGALVRDRVAGADDDAPWLDLLRDGPGPVSPGDFPDPEVVVDGRRLVAYGTNVGSMNVPTLVGTARGWEAGPDALPERPAWATPDGPFVWAPALRRHGDGWVMLVTARDAATGRQCIGAAISARALGPFRADDGPLVCQVEMGGSIDPFLVAEQGRFTLLWKSDGNCCGITSRIWSQRFDPVRRTLLGAPTPLIELDQPWEMGDGPLTSTVEAPAVVPVDDRYLLLYSGGGYGTSGYATGFAVCETLRGPCTKPTDQPILRSGPTVAGPGGASVFRDPRGRWWLAFHAWDPGRVGYDQGGVRVLHLARVRVADGVPTVDLDG